MHAAIRLHGAVARVKVCRAEFDEQQRLADIYGSLIVCGSVWLPLPDVTSVY